MLARTADNCFWLFRNIERIVSTSRVITANQSFIFDVPLTPQEHWFPLITVNGQAENFVKLYGNKSVIDSNLIKNYLVWDTNNPFSIWVSLSQAKSCLAHIKESINLILYKEINGLWLWLNSSKSKELFINNQCEFFENIQNYMQIYFGIFHNSLMRDDCFEFMKIGMMLERILQTLKSLAIKEQRTILASSKDAREILNIKHWLAVLQYCDAKNYFLAINNKEISKNNVIDFLTFSENFPNSISYCIKSSLNSITNLEKNNAIAANSLTYDKLIKFQDELQIIKKSNIETVLHRFTENINEICEIFYKEYFYISNRFLNINKVGQ